MVPDYTVGTLVPSNLASRFPWGSDGPAVDEAKECLGIRGNELVNNKCDGFGDGKKICQ